MVQGYRHNENNWSCDFIFSPAPLLLSIMLVSREMEIYYEAKGNVPPHLWHQLLPPFPPRGFAHG